VRPYYVISPRPRQRTIRRRDAPQPVRMIRRRSARLLPPAAASRQVAGQLEYFAGSFTGHGQAESWRCHVFAAAIAIAFSFGCRAGQVRQASAPVRQ